MTDPDGPAADPLDDAEDGEPADEGRDSLDDDGEPEAAPGAPLPSASVPAAGARAADPQPGRVIGDTADAGDAPAAG